MKPNCNNCQYMRTCKFVNKMKEVAKSNFMYDMFEYLEWNNIMDKFYECATSCKFYVPNDGADKLQKEVEKYREQMRWLEGYTGKTMEDSTFQVKKTNETILKYIESHK